MNKTDLTDVSILIPVRIDSTERLENLNLILDFIKSNFNTTILVLEADKKELVHNSLIDRKIFVEDFDPVFHHTRYRNQMTKTISTPFLAIWDTDVLLEKDQIVNSLNILRSNEADMVLPYNGIAYNVPKIVKRLYVTHPRMDILIKNAEKFRPMYGHFSVGGVFIVNREAYCNAGMENEKFYGWGPEDMERVKRWEVLEYRVKQVNGVLYHLYHPRGKNSWYSDTQTEIKLNREFLHICSKKTM